MKNRNACNKIVKVVCGGKHTTCSKSRHGQVKYTGSQILAYAQSDTLCPPSSENLPEGFDLGSEYQVCANLHKSLKNFLSSTAVGQTLQEKKVSTPSTNCKNGPPPKKKKTLHKKKYATT